MRKENRKKRKKNNKKEKKISRAHYEPRPHIEECLKLTLNYITIWIFFPRLNVSWGAIEDKIWSVNSIF